MNNRIWIIVTAVASIAVIALGVVVGILPKITEAGVNTLGLATVQAQNASYQADLEALKAQFENIDDVRDQLEDLRTSLPAGADGPRFVDEVEQLALATGVQVIETTQTAPIVYGATAADGSDTGTAAAPISGGTLLAIPLTIKVNTTDPLAIFNFMEGLRLGDRLLLITAYDFEVKEENDVQFYEITISLYIYTLVDPSSAPVDAGDGSVPTDPVPAPDPSVTPTPTDTPTVAPTESATPAP